MTSELSLQNCFLQENRSLVSIQIWYTDRSRHPEQYIFRTREAKIKLTPPKLDFQKTKIGFSVKTHRP